MELWLDHLCLFAGLAPNVPEPREPEAAQIDQAIAAAPESVAG